MSGIVGILRTDGGAAKPSLIWALTKSLTFRGPDAQGAWCEGPVGFGHALLRTTREAVCEQQPLTLDGQTWIIAAARVDERHELVSKLKAHGRQTHLDVPDVELVLHAYHVWEADCVEYLLGDFAFAIWDSQKQRLFCARDHMGVKPFYYAHVGPWLLFSNTLECLQLHPAVSNKLNDLAIADFLLFGSNQDPSTTSFHDVRRLPAAHTLTWSDKGLQLRQYWSLPIEEPIHYRSKSEYVDQFVELLRGAVSDRLRTDRVGIFMSGGLDSPALAATAVDLLGNRSTPDPVQAFTFVYNSLIPDSERSYAASVAATLGIPINFYVSDEESEWAPHCAAKTAEPVAMLSDDSAAVRCHLEMAAHSRVAFYGEGPDNALLCEWWPHVASLLRRRHWGRLLADVGKHLPLLLTVPQRLWARRKRRQQYELDFPRWMASELVHRLRLRERWYDLNATPDSQHLTRPRAYRSLRNPLWQALFEAYEPSYTGVALEVRHPYVDTRMLRFLLRVPALPWCRHKHLLRCALRGVVPEAVRLRPKTPLSVNPDYERIRHHGLPTPLPSPLLATYGDAAALTCSRLNNIATVEAALRFVALSYWLHYLDSVRIYGLEEENHGATEELTSGRQ